jgi:hypothetical protein
VLVGLLKFGSVWFFDLSSRTLNLQANVSFCRTANWNCQNWFYEVWFEFEQVRTIELVLMKLKWGGSFEVPDMFGTAQNSILTHKK